MSYSVGFYALGIIGCSVKMRCPFKASFLHEQKIIFYRNILSSAAMVILTETEW